MARATLAPLQWQELMPPEEEPTIQWEPINTELQAPQLDVQVPTNKAPKEPPSLGLYDPEKLIGHPNLYAIAKTAEKILILPEMFTKEWNDKVASELEKSGFEPSPVMFEKGTLRPTKTAMMIGALGGADVGYQLLGQIAANSPTFAIKIGELGVAQTLNGLLLAGGKLASSITGALFGGMAGHEVAPEGGKTEGTIAGALAGAAAGAKGKVAIEAAGKYAEGLLPKTIGPFRPNVPGRPTWVSPDIVQAWKDAGFDPGRYGTEEVGALTKIWDKIKGAIDSGKLSLDDADAYFKQSRIGKKMMSRQLLAEELGKGPFEAETMRERLAQIRESFPPTTIIEGPKEKPAPFVPDETKTPWGEPIQPTTTIETTPERNIRETVKYGAEPPVAERPLEPAPVGEPIRGTNLPPEPSVAISKSTEDTAQSLIENDIKAEQLRQSPAGGELLNLDLKWRKLGTNEPVVNPPGSLVGGLKAEVPGEVPPTPATLPQEARTVEGATTAKEPWQMGGQVSKALDGMLNLAIKNGQKGKGVKEGDYFALNDFVDEVTGLMRGMTKNSAEHEKVMDLASKMRGRINTRIVSELETLHDNSGINNQSRGIFTAINDFKKVVAENIPPTAKHIGFTSVAEGERPLYKIVGGKYDGYSKTGEELHKLGIPYKPVDTIGMPLGKWADNIDVTIREINAAGGDEVKATVIKAQKEGLPVPAEVLKDYPELGKGEGETGGISRELLGTMARISLGAGIGAVTAPEGYGWEGAIAGATLGGTSKLITHLIAKGFTKEGAKEIVKRTVVQPWKSVTVPRSVITKWEEQGLTHKQFASKVENVKLDVADVREVTRKALATAITTNDPVLKDESMKVMWRLHKWAWENKDIMTPQLLKDVAERYGYKDGGQLADDLVASMSHSGQVLAQASYFGRMLSKAFPKDPAVQKVLDDLPKAAWNKTAEKWKTLTDAFRWLDNKTRAALTAQLATAMRNIESQSGRYTIGIFDDALQGVLRTVSGAESPKTAFTAVLSDVNAIWSRMSPKQRKILESVLNQNPMEKLRMLSAPMLDISMGDKAARILNVLNYGQEMEFRKLAFDGKVNELMKRAGLDLAKDKVPEQIYKESVRHALEMTFSEGGRGPAGNTFLAMFKAVPFLTLLQTFPRFWMNSMRFMWEFNPTGLLRYGMSSWATGPRSRESVKALSRTLLGSSMLGGALWLRNSEYAGEKFYQMKIGTDAKTGKPNYYDTRAYAPLIAPYLFLAEAGLQAIGKHTANLTSMDITQGILGVNRIAGTSLAIVDGLLRRTSADTAWKTMKDIIGSYIGRLTVPLRTAKDISGAMGNEEDLAYPTTREAPWTAPTTANLPQSWVPESMRQPAMRTIISREPTKSESPLLRQLTGISRTTKTPIKQEIDRLGITNIEPSTGDPTLDRLITEKAGKVLEPKLNALVKSPFYQRSSDDQKEAEIKKVISQSVSIFTTLTLPKYLDQRLSEIKDKKERFDYFMDLTKHRGVGISDVLALAKRNPKAFTQKEWTAIYAKLKPLESAIKGIKGGD